MGLHVRVVMDHGVVSVGMKHAYKHDSYAHVCTRKCVAFVRYVLSTIALFGVGEVT